MGIPVANGGSKEMAAAGDVVSTFLVMSNELSTPRILYCPSDTNRVWPMTFPGLANSNISYFIGVDVTNVTNPQMIFSGDCNFEIGGLAVKSGFCSIRTNDLINWSSIRHRKYGNLVFGDGTVGLATSSMVQSYFMQTGFATNRLAIP